MQEQPSKKKKIVGYSTLLVSLAIYISIGLFIRIHFPSTADFLAAIVVLYKAHGYLLVFIGALAESTFLLGLYVPGSAIILLGAAISKTGVLYFPYVLLLGTFGLVGGYTINYFLGKHGWYHILTFLGLEKVVEEAKIRLSKHTAKTILLGYFNPASASFISTAAGILRIPFYKFFLLSLFSQFCWALLWGMLAYFFGLVLVEILIKYFSFIVIGLLGLFFLKKKLS